MKLEDIKVPEGCILTIKIANTEFHIPDTAVFRLSKGQYHVGTMVYFELMKDAVPPLDEYIMKELEHKLMAST